MTPERRAITELEATGELDATADAIEPYFPELAACLRGRKVNLGQQRSPIADERDELFHQFKRDVDGLVRDGINRTDAANLLYPDHTKQFAKLQMRLTADKRTTLPETKHWNIVNGRGSAFRKSF